MDLAEDRRKQSVAGHGEPDARLAELIDEQGGDHAHHGSDEHDEPDPVQRVAAGHEGEFFKGVYYGCGVVDHRLPRHEAGEADGDSQVEHGTNDESRDDADGQVTLGLFALLGGGGDRVKADVGEEDD